MLFHVGRSGGKRYEYSYLVHSQIRLDDLPLI